MTVELSFYFLSKKSNTYIYIHIYISIDVILLL